MAIAQRLEELGLEIPPPPALPPGVTLPFAWARAHGERLAVSGHAAVNDDGSPAGPFGRVPSEVSLADAQEAAERTVLAMLGSIEREIGDLDRIRAWTAVHGMVNADPGYDQTTPVLNPFSELVLRIFGDDVGRHARTAVGMTALPMNLSVVVAAELAIAPE
jgi:enamine deaminase RidA (YjgF/YER057c/UK114 family)